MTVARARSPAARSPSKMAGPAASDIIGFIAKRNPRATRDEVIQFGNIVAEIGAAAAKLSPDDRKRLINRKTQLKKLIAQIAAEPEPATQPLKLVARSAAEVSQGEGVGKVLPMKVGLARIADYATQARIGDWAGPVAGPSELERDFGVARSTLHNWQKQGAVIGLLVGLRKHAFPIEQFVDARPVAGLSAIVDAVGDARTAWLWLREPNPGTAGVAPLALLKAGAAKKVLEIARSNFAYA